MTQVSAGAGAPSWGIKLAQDTQQAIDALPRMFISAKPFVVADLTAAFAANFPWRLAIVSDGAANKFIAISNGTAFYYLEGTAV